MKRIYLATILIILLISLSAQISFSQDNEPFSINKSPIPKPSGPVLDNAGVLDDAAKKRLEDKIIKLKKETDPPVELAVAIVKTTGDRPIFDYSIAVARGWGIGSREQDNPGALLFIAIDDRKYFTQVSSDLEDELPDGLVGSLQRIFLVPQFKRGNYAKGIEDTIDAYIRTIKSKTASSNDSDFDLNGSEESKDVGRTRERNNGGFRGYDGVKDYGESNCDGIFICLIIIVIIIFFAMMSGGGGGGKRRRKDDDTSWFYVPTDSGSNWGSSGSSWGSGSSGGGWGGFGGGGDFGGGGSGGGW